MSILTGFAKRWNHIATVNQEGTQLKKTTSNHMAYITINLTVVDSSSFCIEHHDFCTLKVELQSWHYMKTQVHSFINLHSSCIQTRSIIFHSQRSYYLHIQPGGSFLFLVYFCILKSDGVTWKSSSLMPCFSWHRESGTIDIIIVSKINHV